MTLDANPTPCPDPGTWRAWLDQQHGSPTQIDHLQACTLCRQLVHELRDNADLANQALSTLAVSPQLTPAETAVARDQVEWRRRSQAQPTRIHRTQESKHMLIERISTPWRVAASGLAAAIALTLVVAFTPGGQAAASGFLAQFRSQGVSAVELSPQTQLEIVQTMKSLGNFGTVKMGGAASGVQPEVAVRDSAGQAKTMTLAEASTAVGFPLHTPDPAMLPAGVDKTPKIQVMPAQQVRFTIDKAKGDAYLKASGKADLTVPARLDGATLVVSMPAAALVQYSGTDSRDALIVGQSGELVVDVEGGQASLEEMRDWLLTVVPANVAGQLKSIKNWNDTLPVPVPVDRVNWTQASFQGNQGLLLNDNSGVGSAAIWHAAGNLYGVAGSIKATDLERIANSLQARP
jgi:hypothetical protein